MIDVHAGDSLGMHVLTSGTPSHTTYAKHD